MSEARDELAALLEEVRRCRICVERPVGVPLPHTPRPVLRASASARIAVCGQAPGIRVHASGIPFSDPSGVRLRSWMGVTPDEFYDTDRVAIVPMGFCFPGYDRSGGDLPPRRECAPRWHRLLFEQLPRLELVLLVGRYAQVWRLGAEAASGLTETVAAWRGFLAKDSRPRFLPLPHPSWRNNAWLRRNPWFESEVLPALKAEVRRVLDAGVKSP